MKAIQAQSRISVKSILYLTDFSPIAESAVPYALALAHNYGAKIYALHVRPLEIYGMAPPESWPILREVAEEQAKQQAAQLSRYFAGVAHQAIVTEGNTLDSAFAEAEKHHIDLIVMGTHGRKGLEKVVLGSVAENILRRAPCPVLTVNPRVHLTPVRSVEMKRILAAVSFSPASQLAADYAVSLAQENQAHLDILHVMEPQKKGECVPTPDLAEGCSRRMRDMIPAEAELWCEPKTIIEVGEPAEQILNMAKARRADLIVIGVRDAAVAPGAAHNPWATAHKIIAKAECPVLTVRG